MEARKLILAAISLVLFVTALCDTSEEKINDIDKSVQAQNKLLHKTMDEVRRICQDIMTKVEKMETSQGQEHKICTKSIEATRDLTAKCLALVETEESEAENDIEKSKTKLESEVSGAESDPNVNKASGETLSWDSENENRADEFIAMYKNLVKKLDENCESDQIEECGNEILKLAEKFKPTMVTHAEESEKELSKLQEEIND